MKRVVSWILAAALTMAALLFPDCLPAGGSAFSAARADSLGSSVAAGAAAAIDDFNWNGVWQYSAAEQWNVGSNNPLAGAAVYKTVNVTETITISPYTKLEGYSYHVVWDTVTDDGEKVERDEEVFLATVAPYDGTVGGSTPDTQFRAKAEMDLITFDGANVVADSFFDFRILFETEAGDIYSTDFSKTYARIAEGPSTKKELAVSGVLLGPDGKALPRMKLAVDVYYDESAMKSVWDDDLPDLHETLASDLKGVYFVKIPIRADIQTKIGVVITLTLRCQLPQGDAFFLADYQDPNAKDEIRVSTKMVIDPSEADQAYDVLGEVPVVRAIQFADVPGGCLTRDDAGAAEPMQTNLSDPQKLFGYGYVYRVLWDALTVGGVVFDELACLMQSPTSDPLRIDCNYLPENQDDASHYSAGKNAIRLEAVDCGFDDPTRFTVLHEFGHFFDTATNDKWEQRCGWSAKIKAGEKNHGGYLNQSTADSFVEGFATWYALVCQIYRKDANPCVAGKLGDLTKPLDWPAWANGGIREEFSIASVLLKAMLQFEDAKDFWQAVLRNNCSDFYGYYATMRVFLGKDSGAMAVIDRHMIAAGLFRMPYGNGKYDFGEPYRDLDQDGKFTEKDEDYTDANKNHQYDPPEPFEDADKDKHFDAVEEPYQDTNGDGQYDFGEAYSDLDGDGRHDEAESYTDTDGDGAWFPGEPFVDVNHNEQRDVVEPYGDLMFPYSASFGSIDLSGFPDNFNFNGVKIGESAADNYPNRYSTFMEDNCFIALSGEAADAVKVAVRLSDGSAYGYVASPEARGIYVGLPNRDLDGTVEISVPGGGVIYRGDVRALQQKIVRTIGQFVPLDSASIRKSDLAPEGTIAAPTGGDADASGVFAPVEISNREAGILADHYDPKAEIDSLPDVEIRPEEPEETSEPKETVKPEMTAAPKATAKPKATAAPEGPDHGRTPEGTAAQSPIADVAAGEYFTLGLRQNGTVVAAGDNAKGQCDVSEWTEIEAIAAGLEHSVGLTRDGTVVAAGDNELGQCDVEDWEDIVQISAGYGHTVGLRADGTVVAAGYNGDGQLNVGKWRDIIAVAAGGWHTIGLKANGTVVATGYNQYGQCDVKKWSGIAAIAAGGWHTLGIRNNGRVVSAGYGESGQRDVGKWRSVTQISASGYHTVGLVEGVPPIAVGSDEYGQCEMSLWEDVIRIAAGGYHTVGLLGDGSVVAVGNDDYGQCEVANWGAGAPESYDGSGE